jgi:hypothetical protein
LNFHVDAAQERLDTALAFVGTWIKVGAVCCVLCV